jgi:hypothetical protein
MPEHYEVLHNLPSALESTSCERSETDMRRRKGLRGWKHVLAGVAVACLTSPRPLLRIRLDSLPAVASISFTFSFWVLASVSMRPAG